MKIILLMDIKKQGKKGDILDVKDGYGNFLIKNKQAVVASSYGVDRLERENEKKALDEEKLVKACIVIKNKLEKEKISFKVNTGAQDKVFGKISAKQISEELKNKGYDIDKKQIRINDSINILGSHIVQIELHKNVIANLNIQLSKWGVICQTKLYHII